LSSELKSADLEGEDLSREILACENKVYETFLGPQPDVEAFQTLTLPDYLSIPPNGVISTREENVIALKSGVAFSSIQIKNSQVRKLSPTSALIVARVLIEAAAGGHNISSETLTSTVWVKQDGKWLAQLHTSTKVAQGSELRIRRRGNSTAEEYAFPDARAEAEGEVHRCPCGSKSWRRWFESFGR
jgi:hypothetical protein